MYSQEADNWTTLSADMDEVFQSQNVDDVSLVNDSFVLSILYSVHIMLTTHSKYIDNIRQKLVSQFGFH